MNTASHVMTPARARDSATDAWTAFWADPGQSRCAAGAPAIWQVLRNHWTSFSARLAPGTCVLDLGCGAGVVGRLLVAGRSDLEVTGVDTARISPAAHPHLTVLSHTAMEALPFPERRFGAAVSQFGFEYSQTAATALEISRVLIAGARLSFLVHHADSAIVASTRARLDAIGAFLAPAMRDTFCARDAAGFRSQVSSLLARHPHDPLIAQLAQALPPRLGSPQPKRIAIWAAIDEALAPERRVAESLIACCIAPPHLAQWLGPLASVCELMPVTVLREPNGDPIAWSVEGVRRH